MVYFRKLIKKIVNKIIDVVYFCCPKRVKGWIRKAALIILRKSHYAIRETTSNNEIAVAIQLEGGMGDSIINAAWVKEFYKQMDCPVLIDIFGRDDLKFVLNGHSYVNNIMPHSLFENVYGYDIKFKIGHFVLVKEVNLHKIASKSKKLIQIVECLNAFSEKYSKYAFSQPYYDGVWAKLCTHKGWNRWDELGANEAIEFSRNNNAMLHIDTIASAILKKYKLDFSPFITLHTGSDVAIQAGSLGTKVWPLERWAEFCQICKKKYPNITLVQIGPKLSNPIPGVDVNLLGKTSLSESAVLLKHAALHIDGESGLVHLRNQLGKRSIVLFGPTPVDFYGYKQNTNIVSEKCLECMWMTDDWFTVCPKGLSAPECMAAITAEMVLSSTIAHLEVPCKPTIAVLMDSALYSPQLLTTYKMLSSETFFLQSVSSMNTVPSDESPFTLCQTLQSWEHAYIDKTINGTGPSLCIAVLGDDLGVLSSHLAKLGHTVTAYDVVCQTQDTKPLDWLRQFVQYANAHGFTAESASAFNIPNEDESFDIIICTSRINLLALDNSSFEELLRILKPGGKLVVTCRVSMKNDKSGASIGKEITISDVNSFFKNLFVSSESVFNEHDFTSSVKHLNNDNKYNAKTFNIAGFLIEKYYK